VWRVDHWGTGFSGDDCCSSVLVLLRWGYLLSRLRYGLGLVTSSSVKMKS
jgi:hypothetical protein